MNIDTVEIMDKMKRIRTGFKILDFKCAFRFRKGSNSFYFQARKRLY